MRKSAVENFKIVINNVSIHANELNKMLDKDIRVSRDDNIVVCILCDKVYAGMLASMLKMRAHIESHVDDLHFVCQICESKAYSTRSACYVHISKKHPQ